MPPPRQSDGVTSNDRGSASVEFLVVAVGFLMPLVALTTTVTEIATASFAAGTMARQSARAMIRAPSVAEAHRTIATVSTLVFDDFGIADRQWSADIDCSAPSCLRRGSLVSVTISVAVPLRFVPDLPGISLPRRVTVSQRVTARVPTFVVNR